MSGIHDARVRVSGHCTGCLGMSLTCFPMAVAKTRISAECMHHGRVLYHRFYISVEVFCQLLMVL